MSKKKHKDKNGGKGGQNEAGRWHKNLKPETKHSLWAVLSFAAAVLLTLAYFGEAGLAGKAIKISLDAVFGKGFFLVPMAFLLAGLSFLFALGNHLFVTTAIGALLFLLSSLGLADILFGQYTGGFVGFAVSFPFLKLFDFWASLVLILVLLFVSIIIMLNFSIKPGKKEKIDEKPGTSPVPAPQIPTAPPEAVAATAKPEEPENKEEEESKTLFNMFSRAKPVKVQRQTIKELSSYIPPPLDLLEGDKGTPSSGDIKANANIIKRTLQNFGVDVEMSEVNVGPSVTQYTLKPAEGIKLSRITALQNDLALALAAHPLRIEAPIPGKSLVGIEIPNRSISLVGLRSLFSTEDFQKAPPLTITLGRDVSGREVYADIAKMPHLLIAGATGAGKSVAIHSLIVSLLYKNSPQFLRFLMIDPKRVELTGYNNIPHLLAPVITDAKKTILSLRWAVREMERRYEKLSEISTRDINSYNNEMISEKSYGEVLPNIVIIIDELADLIAAYPREMEASIVRLAQMSRAVGIHLVVSTQRPSVEVITGLIKANITARVALQVASGVDSRTILDMSGAEKLLGNGDMLFLAGDVSKPRRIQGGFISEKEVKKVTAYLKEKAGDFDLEPVDMDIKLPVGGDPNAPSDFLEDGEVDDELYEEAKKLVIEAGKASTSYLQRRLRIGYARAASIIDMLEERGVVGAGEGAKPRDVLMKNGGGDAADRLIADFEANKKFEEREMEKAMRASRSVDEGGKPEPKKEKPAESLRNQAGRSPAVKADEDDDEVPYTNFDF
ncbi:MAG: DNA translocase FtsK [bacterium]|nr:DNA translocase FtsK [bacterium]